MLNLPSIVNYQGKGSWPDRGGWYWIDIEGPQDAVPR